MLQKVVTHKVGRFAIVGLFLVLAIPSGLGAGDILQDLDRKDLFTDDQVTYKFFDYWDRYFYSEGDFVNMVIENDTFITTATQQSYKTFITHLKACTGCRTDWVVDTSVTQWYSLFAAFAFSSGCTSGAMTASTDDVPAQFFMNCFRTFITHDFGTNSQNAMVYNSSAIISMVVPFKTTRERSQKAGRPIFEDLRTLVETYGLTETYFYSGDTLLFEAYDLNFDSITLIALLSFAVILCVFFFFTANVIVSLCLVVAVGLEFLFGVAAFDWFTLDLRYTNLFHFFFMVPVLVTFNVHIAHKYLQFQADEVERGVAAKQKQKVIFALEKVGPAVMHGCATIFLAVLPLGLARSFLFQDMFKIWLIMVLFGTLHALLFLPALLAIVGPLNRYEDESEFKSLNDAEGTSSLGATLGIGVNQTKTHPQEN